MVIYDQEITLFINCHSAGIRKCGGGALPIHKALGPTSRQSGDNSYDAHVSTPLFLSSSLRLSLQLSLPLFLSLSLSVSWFSLKSILVDYSGMFELLMAHCVPEVE